MIQPPVVYGNGAIAGYKYFNFDGAPAEGESTSLQLDLIPKGVDATIDVYMRTPEQVNTDVTANTKIGTFTLRKDMPQVTTTVAIPTPAVDEVDGQQGIFFKFNLSSNAICDFDNLKFLEGEGFFIDDFEGNLNHTLMLSSDGAKVLNKQGETWSDYAVTADITSLQGTLNLRFRQSDEDNYYNLAISKDKLELSSTLYGENTVLKSKNCNIGEDAFTLVVDNVKSSIAVRVNGAMLLTVKNDDHLIGGVGFVIDKGNAAAINEAKVDQVEVGDSHFTPPDDGGETSDRTDSISIDSAPLEGLTAGNTQYQVTVEGNNVPAVTASSTDPDVKVSVAQASAVPGTAIIRFIDQNGNAKTYTVSFKGQEVEIPMIDSVLPEGWEAFGTGTDLVTADSDGIKLNATQGGDYPNVSPAFPAIQKNDVFEGNWQFDVNMQSDKELNGTGLGSGANYQAYGPALYKDTDNYMRFMVQCESWNGNKPKILLKGKNNGSEFEIGNKEISGAIVTFRLVKTGDMLSGYFSADGTQYQTMGNAKALSFWSESKPQVFATKVFGQTEFAVTVKSIKTTDLGETITLFADQTDIRDGGCGHR